ncbi:uncharacterized protein LOC100378522 [Saccoglossus kowalevskii]
MDTTNERQPRKPLRSWTKGSQKEWERRENGMISPRALYGRGEWALRECEEHTTWANNHLKKKKFRLIDDLRKRIGDGTTLVNLLEILTNEKIPGINSRPIIRAQKVENIQRCLQYLDAKGVPLYGITTEELVDGNLKSSLSLISTVKDSFEPKYQLNGAGSNNPGVGRVNNDGEAALGFYSSSVLPGTMADAVPASNHQISHTEKIVSTTQLDKRKVEQHGADQRRQQLIRSSSSTITPQPQRSPPNAWSSNTQHPVRDTVSLTVEERLKTLLDSPHPGVLQQQNNKDYDDGELLQPPPPPRRTPSRFMDDNDSDDGRVKTMTDGTVKYDAYSGDWDPYPSTYVPSHVGEKKEGPRVQALLERPRTTSPTSPRQNHVNNRMSPPSSSQPGNTKSPSNSTSSSSLVTPSWQQTRAPSSGSVDNLTRAPPSSSVDNLRDACNKLYSGHPSQTPPYLPRKLPTYYEHLHRHPGQQSDWRDQSPTRQRESSPSRERESSPTRHSSNKLRESSPTRQYSRDVSPTRQPHHFHDSARSLPQNTIENPYERARSRDSSPIRKNMNPAVENKTQATHVHRPYPVSNYQQDQRRMELYQKELENERQQKSVTTHNSLPINRLASQDSNYSTVSYNSITDSMTSAHTQMSSYLSNLPSSIKTTGLHSSSRVPPKVRENPHAEGRIDLELNYTPSESSSRSHTPPLPPLSPDNTPPITPPESPPPTRSRTSSRLSPFEQLAKMKNGSDRRKKGYNRGPSSQIRLYPHGLFHRGSGRNKQRKRYEKPILAPPIAELAKSEDSNEDDTVRDSESITLHLDTGQDSYGLASESQTEDSSRPRVDADSVRHQLIALEKMYQDILNVVSGNKDDKFESRRFSGSQQSLQSRGRFRGMAHRNTDLVFYSKYPSQFLLKSCMDTS